MANKLTKKKIDLLIEQAMNEDFTKEQWRKLYPAKSDLDFEDHPRRTPDMDSSVATIGSDSVWNSIAPSVSGKNQLTLADIRHYNRNPGKITSKIQSQLIAISRLGFGGNENKFDQVINKASIEAEKSKEKESNIKRADSYQARLDNKSKILNFAKEAESALKTFDDLQAQVLTRKQTITNPKITTAGSDIPIFNQVQRNAIITFMTGADSIDTATKKLSDMSKLYYDAAIGNSDAEDSIKGKTPQAVLNEIQVLELLASAIKEYGSQESAYLMETLFAMLYGGAQAGKIKTSAGKDGAVDFTAKFGENEETGSAKMYASANGISQDLKGFKDMAQAAKESYITYIVGLKKQDVSQQGDLKKGTAEPQKIMLVELLVVRYKVVRTENDYSILHDDDSEATFKDGRLDVTASLRSGKAKSYPLYLAQVRTKTFKEMIDASINESIAGVGQAYKFFKQYYESLQAASNNAKEYINLGDTTEGQQKGQQVYENLGTAETNYTGLVSQLTYKNNKPTKPVQENKTKSLKELDKLIEHVILNKMNK